MTRWLIGGAILAGAAAWVAGAANDEPRWINDYAAARAAARASGKPIFLTFRCER
jgi:hypothetical protein